jgi:hypothetical protein
MTGLRVSAGVWGDGFHQEIGLNPGRPPSLPPRTVAARDHPPRYARFVSPHKPPSFVPPPPAGMVAQTVSSTLAGGRPGQPAPSPACSPPVLSSVVRLPLWRCPPESARTERFGVSFLAQMDGIMYASLGLRLEVDVLSPSADQSYLRFWGCDGYTSWSTFVGLFFGNWNHMAEIVATAVSHQCIGLFIVPVGPFSSKGIVQKKGPPLPWLQVLRNHALLTFSLLDPRFISPTGDDKHALSFGVMAIVASFNWAGKLKSKQKKAKKYDIWRLELPVEIGSSKLERLPFIPTRVSPLAEATPRLLPRSMDSCGATPSWAPSDVPLPPSPVPPTGWNVSVFNEWAARYPFKEVAALACKAVAGGIELPFAGDPEKAVIRPNSASLAGKEDEIRATLVAETAIGRMCGPFERPPFPSPSCPMQPRSVPLLTVPKKKHDPTNEEFRLCSDFSAGADGSSVNDLFWRPEFTSFHCGAKDVRELMWAQSDEGKSEIRVWAGDKPKCFRSQRNAISLLALFVYHITTKSKGKEWWVDLRNPFGKRFAEWGWQSILAIVEWEIRARGLSDEICYVDNFMLVSEAGPVGAAREVVLTDALSEVGIDLHELQPNLPTTSMLGWDWIRERRQDGFFMAMSCPDVKRVILDNYLSVWAGADTGLSLAALRKAVGLMNWVAAAFAQGTADVAPLIHMRTAGEAIHRRKPELPPAEIVVAWSPHAKIACAFWHNEFKTWNGQRALFADFGPFYSWQALIQIDASTAWGWGGFIWIPPVLVGISQAWSTEERKSAFVRSRESTGFFETLAVQLFLSRVAVRCAGLRVELDMDNRESARSICSGYSQRPLLLDSVRKIWSTCVRSQIVLRVCHILGVPFNPIADALSHNRLAEAKCLARERFGTELVLLPATPSLSPTQL